MANDITILPYANSPHHTGEILGFYLVPIQAGGTTGADGLPEMKYISLSELQAFVRQGFGSAMTFRGQLDALPESPAVNDYFIVGTTFEDDGVMYYANHFYEYDSDGDWVDISDILGQYATQEYVAGIDERLQGAEADVDELQDAVSAMQGNVTLKGSVNTYGDLPSNPSQGDQYWVETESKYYTWNGTEWVATGAMANLGLTIRGGRLCVRYKV